MRIILLLALLLSSKMLVGQNCYVDSADQTAIKSAYRILKAFYPDKQLCVSDSVFDFDEWAFKGIIDDEIYKELEAQHIANKYALQDPMYEQGLANLLNADTCISSPNSVYADFSFPYHGMIRCDIMPINRRLAIFGIIPQFLFFFDAEGAIYQVNKVDLIVN